MFRSWYNCNTGGVSPALEKEEKKRKKDEGRRTKDEGRRTKDEERCHTAVMNPIKWRLSDFGRLVLLPRLALLLGTTGGGIGLELSGGGVNSSTIIIVRLHRSNSRRALG